MSPEPQRPPVVVVTGPTAAGKTERAIELALAVGGEIVNADSMQVYRYLDIGTAKPSLAQRARVPHHLIDVVTPDDPYDAARFWRDARAAAAGIHARGRPVVLCGGTGLYIRAFLEGLTPAGGADPELRERLEAGHRRAREAGDPDWLHRQLALRDPRAAARLHPNDARRLIRALELLERGGLTRAAAPDPTQRPYRVLHLCLDPGREALRERIAQRCRRMIDAGLLQEVRALRDRGYGPELRPLQAIGYRHVNPVVEGLDTLANALEAMVRDTRRFARRQRTWLRGVPGLVGFHPDDREGLRKAVEAFLSEDAGAAAGAGGEGA